MSGDDRVFKALADPTRRFLLDRLFVRDGRTLTELESAMEDQGAGGGWSRVLSDLKTLLETGASLDVDGLNQG